MYNSYGNYFEVQDEKNTKNKNMAVRYMPYIFEDARSHQSAMNRGDYNKAVAEAEQMGEKSLKAIAQNKGKLSNNLKRKNGHDLIKLANACDGIELGVSKQDLQMLTDAYFSSRYPEGKKKYTKEEAENSGKVACKLLDTAIDELNIPLTVLDKELGTAENQDRVEMLGSFSRLMK